MSSPDEPSHGCHNERVGKYYSPLDIYLKTLDPDHVLPSEETVITKLLLTEPDNPRLDEFWENYKAQCEAMIEHLQLPINRVGDKPKEGDPTLCYYRIPSSPYAIRVWDGSMHQYGLWLYDLYDVNQKSAVNLPDDFQFVNGPHPGVYTVQTGENGPRIISWEEAWGMKRKDIPHGEERYTGPEGGCLMLQRKGQNPFYFALPIRPRLPLGEMYAQPQLSI